MAKYVDGFVLVVPEKNLEAYRRIAREAGKVWCKYGALDYKECVGDDLQTKGMTLTFPKMTNLKRGEKVVFSYIVFKSRAHRDRVNEKVMKDPFMMQPQNKTMPFDMKRLAYGGFEVIVDVQPPVKKKK